MLEKIKDDYCTFEFLKNTVFKIWISFSSLDVYNLSVSQLINMKTRRIWLLIFRVLLVKLM